MLHRITLTDREKAMAAKQADANRQRFEEICNACGARNDHKRFQQCAFCPTEEERQGGVTTDTLAVSGMGCPA